MLYVKPDFYDDFVCKAGECSDTCCAGWEITVDDKSMLYYASEECPVSAEIAAGTQINDDGETVFKLKDKERCFFLCDDGLCRIYSECGKDALCDICSEHPRFYNIYEDSEEAGLGLCCERVCEMLFDESYSLGFDVQGSCDDADYSYLFNVRQACYSAIYCSTDFSAGIRDMLLLIYDVSEFSDTELKLRQDFDTGELFSEILGIFSKTEPVSDEWTQLIAQLSVHLNEICSISGSNPFNEEDYRKLLLYLIYRHLIESAYISDLLYGVCFAVAGVIFVHMCNCLSYLQKKSLNKADIICNTKMFSKQIEYSAENTELVMNSSVGILFDKVG